MVAEIQNLAPFLTTRTLAQRWDVSDRTIERHRSAGEGPPFIKVGRSVRYQLEDVLAYEAAHRHGGLA